MNLSFPTITTEFYLAALPVLLLAAGSIVAMLQAVFKKIGSENAVFGFQIATLIAALVAAIMAPVSVETAYLAGNFLAGEISQFGQVTIIVVASILSLMFKDTWLKSKFFRGEISALWLMVICGMLVMVSSEDMITLFVGLELSSIGLYAILGYVEPTRRSQEGAIKYFVLGSFASALLLFGFGLLYSATGTMRLSEIVEIAPRMKDHNWVQLGALFSMAGIGFKLALAPFHLWAPDAYEAAPTGVTALMATTVKVMIIIVAMRLFGNGLSSIYEVWMPALMFLAVVSMIVGNIMALVQNSLKRMLAYSSIAHSGYMAIAICAIGSLGGEFPYAAILYYLVGYAVISIGAFGFLMWLENEQNDNITLDNLSGMGAKHPVACFAFAVFMFSFAGMPPTVGFISKFFVFNAALKANLYSLVIIGIIGSSISLYYYLRVIVRMFMNEPVKVAAPLAPKQSFVVSGVVAVSVILILLLGTVLPGPVMERLVTTSQEIAKN